MSKRLVKLVSPDVESYSIDELKSLQSILREYCKIARSSFLIKRNAGDYHLFLRENKIQYGLCHWFNERALNPLQSSNHRAAMVIFKKIHGNFIREGLHFCVTAERVRFEGGGISECKASLRRRIGFVERINKVLDEIIQKRIRDYERKSLISTLEQYEKDVLKFTSKEQCKDTYDEIRRVKKASLGLGICHYVKGRHINHTYITSLLAKILKTEYNIGPWQYIINDTYLYPLPERRSLSYDSLLKRVEYSKEIIKHLKSKKYAY